MEQGIAAIRFNLDPTIYGEIFGADEVPRGTALDRVAHPMLGYLIDAAWQRGCERMVLVAYDHAAVAATANTGNEMTDEVLRSLAEANFPRLLVRLRADEAGGPVATVMR